MACRQESWFAFILPVLIKLHVDLYQTFSNNHRPVLFILKGTHKKAVNQIKDPQAVLVPCPNQQTALVTLCSHKLKICMPVVIQKEFCSRDLQYPEQPFPVDHQQYIGSMEP
ncbi:uncharacterized protein LOC134237735 [Saccostrea cucullata]|uniref:uncharacterized protein LOC134237735 n=1 Tax=Saccostrea cuccullata TaxID=36930 RepID=UPI002ED06F15